MGTEKLGDLTPFTDAELGSTPQLSRGNLLGGAALEATKSSDESLEGLTPFTDAELGSTPQLSRGNLLGGAALEATTDQE